MRQSNGSKPRPIPRVTVIGAGNVGSVVAKHLLDAHLADVVLVDVVEGRPQGIALDLSESGALVGYTRSILGTNDYDDTADSDLIVVTAGLPRKPGMSRDDLTQVNGRIVMQTVRAAIARSPDAILIVVTNPLDVMTELAWRVSGLPCDRVMGMAGVLDTARFRSFVAQELGVPVADVSALVLGGHGDLMVPLPNFATVGGVPLLHLMPEAVVQRLVARTRNGGAEVVELLKTGGAYYAPGAAVFQMVAAILQDQHRILPVSAYLRGEYDLEGLYLGVPCRLGKGGIEQVIEVGLTAAQRSALHRSAAAVRATRDRAMDALLHKPPLPV